MDSRERPPANIAPHAFFTDWLPARVRVPPGLPHLDLRVRVHLDGEGGGAWELTIAEGALAVAAPGGGEAEITVWQSVRDWRALLGGDGAGGDLAPPRSAPDDLLFLDAQTRQLIRTIRGGVRFEISGLAGRTWRLDTKFGTQPARPEPDAVIATDAATYAAIAARRLPPPEAYFSGRIQIRGDAGLAMQLGMALLPRFT